MKKVLFVLGGNLSTTPRALKSILTASKIFDVEVLSVNRSLSWSLMDKSIALNNNIKNQNVSLVQSQIWDWVLSSLVCKLSKVIVHFFLRNNVRLNAYASGKSVFLLEQKLKNYTSNYDIVIGHSYGGLYPAFYFSLNKGIPFILDIEDFHPGEAVGHGKADEKSRREFLLKKILPKAGFITYASPLIGEYSLNLIPDYPKEKSALINNCFFASDFSFKENHNEKISFVWFSQNITAARGLEVIVPFLYHNKKKVHLTLIGHLYQSFYDDFLAAYKEVLTIIPPLSQDELHNQLAYYDVGLALEVKNSDLNKRLALSNKIFAYAQSGLFILASDTEAQNRFIEDNPLLGIVVNLESPDLSTSVEHLLNNIQEIRKLKKERFDYAKKLSWDHESQKLMEIWEKMLQ